MKIRLCGILLADAALSLLFQAGTGCSFTHGVADTVYSNSYICSCKCEPGERHRDLRVDHPDDNAEQTATGSILIDDGDLDFVNGRYVALRFHDVLIPPNAPILHARVQFTASAGSTTGSLALQVAGEAADNAGPFTTTAGSIAALPTTAAKVSWNPPNWTAESAGMDELTPDLNSVVQQIVDRPGWMAGNALAIIIKGTAGAALRKAYSLKGGLDRAAVLSVDYTEPLSNVEVLQNLAVCVPDALNQNVGGSAPADADLTADCGDGTLTPGHRVQDTVTGLAQACNYPSLCTCQVLSGSQDFKGSCDDDTGSGPGVCTAVPVATDCSNFDPPHDVLTATNAPGDTPVCAANSPLSASLFGRNTSCEVKGKATVKVGDDSESSDASGLLEFVGDPCPGRSCAVGLKHRLDIGSVTFGNFFHSETFSDLGGLGESLSGEQAVLTDTGGGTFAQHTVGASAHGRRGGGDLKGLDALNQDVVNVTVGWGSSTPMCHLDGTLLGNVDPEAAECKGGPDDGNPCTDDSQCTPDDSCGSDGVCHCVKLGTQGLSLSLSLDGDIVNQPPTADAGPDQSVECGTAAVTQVVLDGSASSDPDGDIRLYSWLRGTRVGQEVAFDEISRIEQHLGSQTYVLRVIDSRGQAGEDSTEVDVFDTTPPIVTCSVETSTLSPPSHDLVNVGLAASSVDQCEGALPVTVKVFANEEESEDTGDGTFSPDARDIAVATLRLRVERKGNGSGRVYLVIPESTDSSGNRGFSCCAVAVPVSASPAAQMTAQAQATAARDFCQAHRGTAPSGYSAIGIGPVVGPKQ